MCSPMLTIQNRRQHLLLLAAAGAGLTTPAIPARAQETPFSSGREPPRLKAPRRDRLSPSCLRRALSRLSDGDAEAPGCERGGLP